MQGKSFLKVIYGELLIMNNLVSFLCQNGVIFHIMPWCFFLVLRGCIYNTPDTNDTSYKKQNDTSKHMAIPPRISGTSQRREDL